MNTFGSQDRLQRSKETKHFVAASKNKNMNGSTEQSLDENTETAQNDSKQTEA